MSTSDRKFRILCVEDDQQMRSFLQRSLRTQGYQVQAVRDGAQAIEMAATFQPQLVLLDLSLPTLDGLTFLRRLKKWSEASVIVLSAHDEEPVKIRALDLGADDYVTKPFSVDELLARVRAAIRRIDDTAKRSSILGIDAQRPFYRYGGENGLLVDYVHRLVRSGGNEVHLTRHEYELLSTLTRNAGKVLTHRELLQRVWGPEHSSDNTYLRTFVRHLRRKLEPDPAQPRFLHNKLGFGYYVPPPDPAEI